MSDDDVVRNGIDSIDDEENQESDDCSEEPITRDKGLWRDLLAFWFLGLSNNYGYVVMLSAAHDIIEHFGQHEVSTIISWPLSLFALSDISAAFRWTGISFRAWIILRGTKLQYYVDGSFTTSRYTTIDDDKNYRSLFAILYVVSGRQLSSFEIRLNDFFSMIIFLSAFECLSQQFFPHWVCSSWLMQNLNGTRLPALWWHRSVVVSVNHHWWRTHRISTSMHLSVYLFFAGKSIIIFVVIDRNVISTWASGTGAAGIAGAFTYAFLLNLGFTAKSSLHLMLIIPCLEAVAFFIILRRPRNRMATNSPEPMPHSADETTTLLSPQQETVDISAPTFREKIEYFPKLFMYILPLFAVYFCEYFINQGLVSQNQSSLPHNSDPCNNFTFLFLFSQFLQYELIYLPNIWLDRASQYRWLQVTYQIGVFVSRSTVNLFTVRNIWLMSMLQMVNVFYFTSEAIYSVTPNIWLIFMIVFWEGLLGGSCYVNTFYRIVREVPEHFRKFAMGMTGIGESFGIVVAGLLAIPAHNTICTLPLNIWEFNYIFGIGT